MSFRRDFGRGDGIPAAARGSEEDVFERGLFATERAHAKILGEQRAQQRLTEVVVAIQGVITEV